ncbi:MAG: hypothetical protein PUB13_06730 [Lachnospiraceae bacterium]|nr:hypothetical protein [Lachnospiraceae bacterium]
MREKLKWLAVVLCLSLFAMMALGSGSSNSQDTKEIVTTDNSESQAGESSESQETTENSKSSTDITIDEQILIDQNDIVITATEYVSDSIWGDGIKLLVVNNSTQNITIGCTALIVNDYMISDLFATEVAAGKKANDTIYLSSSGLKAAGIDTVGQVEIYFHIYDSDSMDKIFDSDCVTIQTSEYANMDTTPNDAGTELYNEGGIRIVGKAVDENSFWGTAILLYCENTSGKNVGISVDDMSINGFMMNPIFSTTVYDGKKAIDDITIFSSDLEENGITAIEEVELKFHIYDADSYSTITDSDAITFSAQ